MFRFITCSRAGYAKNHGAFLVLSHLMVFLIGLYITQRPAYIDTLESYDGSDATFNANVNKGSANISGQPSFFDIGIKYRTDKVTDHHYETMYEKYLRKYIGSKVSLLEIGLGCGMSFGTGASAYVWREYLGPQANIHFIEGYKECAEKWYKTNGNKVDIYRIFREINYRSK